MTSHRPATSITAFVLGRMLSRDRASAILGDVAEELERRTSQGETPRWPRAWCEARAAWYLGVELRAAMPRRLRSLWHLARTSVRGLRAAPASTAFILLILTLAISAATVTFSVVDAVVLRRLPFPESDSLVVLRMGDSEGATFSTREFEAWRDADVFANLAAHTAGGTIELSTDAGNQSVGVASVTASVFQMLRVPPAAGRWLAETDEVPGRDAEVVVISDDLARRLYGGVEAAVGQPLRTSSATMTVVGVMPPTFGFPLDVRSPVEVWRPLAVTSSHYSSSSGGLSRYFRLVGRLQPDGSPERARAGLDSASGSLRAAFPQSADDWPPRLVPLYDSLVGDVRGWMLLVLIAVTLVMLVACANAANLLLVRASVRAREMSLRAALGASRRHLVAGLLVESLLLSFAASALGMLVAMWGLDLATASLPADIARVHDIAIDRRVLASVVAAAITTGLIFGAVPAWQTSRADLVTVLKDGSATTLGPRTRWRTAFVVLEVAFVGVVLVATTLVVASFVNVTRADIGFDRDRLIATDMVRVTAPIDSALEDLRSVAGVESAGAMAMGTPPLFMRGFSLGGSASMELSRPDRAIVVSAQSRRVSDDYFQTAGTVFRLGGGFDRVPGPAVILDELAAAELFPDRDPIGGVVYVGRPRPGTVPGGLVVTGVISRVQVDGPEVDATPQVYMPLVPRPGTTSQAATFGVGYVSFVLRTSGPPAAVVPAVDAALARLSPVPAGRRASRVFVIEDAFRNITAERRFNARLMTLLGCLALVIGIAGVYGVMASVVAQRTREIGVRVALGATQARIRRDVLGRATWTLGVGLAIGLPAAWLLTRAFGSIYFGITPSNLAVYVGVAALLGATGVLAAALPAHRASRVDPVVALRD